MPLIRRSSDQASAPARSHVTEAGDVLVTLATGNSEERWAAARIAAESPGGVEALGRALSTEEDLRVREAIFTSLARVRTSESVQAIIPHLRSDDANLRTGALDALRAMREAAGPFLPSLLADHEADVRLLACDLARGLPVSEASRLLCGLIEEERQANVCAAAVDVLADIGGPETLPVLQRCAERFRDDPFLGFSIKVTIERIGSQSPARRG